MKHLKRNATKHYNQSYMITLYKQIETKGLYYKEMWYENADKVLIEHSGKVGYVGTIAKTSMTEKEAAIRLQDFSNVCASEGYTKCPKINYVR